MAGFKTDFIPVHIVIYKYLASITEEPMDRLYYECMIAKLEWELQSQELLDRLD